MAPQFPSIQSFFLPEVFPYTQKRVSSPTTVLGDAFTPAEVEGALQPILPKWQPRTKYEDKEIGDLAPGPGCVTLMGRVVNLNDRDTPSKMPQAAKGCIKLLVKDNTGVLMVNLWYMKIEYAIRLGHLVSIWTPHVSNAASTAFTLQNASCRTSIFPERDNTCYFLIQEQSDTGILCKTPLGYQEGAQLAGLMTVKSFVDGGYDAASRKVLVCVKSIGGRKKFTTKKGALVEKVDVKVFDDTQEATLTLWGSLTASASSWKPSYTILLLSNPGSQNAYRPTMLIGESTHVDVDPCMADGYWLRGYAQRLTKRDHVNQPFPENVFDIDSAASSEMRILFTIADIDVFVRAAPAENFIGWLSVIISDYNITNLYRRNMLMCTECCGVPLFCNTTRANCKQCEKENELRINPRLVGLMSDETGSITCGKLIWATEAWEDLLGRTAEELASSSTQLLKYMEQRLLFLRVSLMVGWHEDVGKLTVLRVRL